MSETVLPRPAVKYLANLPSATQAWLSPLLQQVQQALSSGRDEGEIVDILAAQPVPEPKGELLLLEALVRLAHPLLPEIVHTHFSRPEDRNRQKALKKAYHYLKAQGVAIPAHLTAPTEEAVVRPLPGETAVKGYMSRIEGNGSRMVILQISRLGQPFNLFMALVNDVEGIKDAYDLLLGLKEVKKYLEETRENMPGELVEFPAPFLFQMIEDAYQLNPDPSSKGVAAFLRVRGILKNRFGQEKASDILELLPVLEDRETYLEQSKELVLEEDFFSWQCHPHALRPWLEKLQGINDSPLVLSKEQKIARIAQTVEDACHQTFTPEKRKLFSRRLLEMAYYLDQTERPHLARMAQAAGEDLLRLRSSLEPENPFLFGLLMVPLRIMYALAEEEMEETPETEKRIITDFF
ncbi:MAG: hypothetical protein FJ135_06615 [Deltaproteobacteria bacterium]|nr:hypothetical protein [Deltaproteobacteria bacterium]